MPQEDRTTTEYRPIRKVGSGVSPVIAIILMVAIPAVLASVLYVSVSDMSGGMLIGSSGGHSCLGPQVRIQSVDGGWFAEFLTVTAGTRPAGIFLEVRGPDGTVSLQRTSLSGLRPGSGAAYRDANPQVDEVRPRDGIVLDTRFFDRSTLVLSEQVTGMVTVRVLE